MEGERGWASPPAPSREVRLCPPCSRPAPGRTGLQVLTHGAERSCSVARGPVSRAGADAPGLENKPLAFCRIVSSYTASHEW